LCAIPLTAVVETMRPLPVERLGGAPRFVLGLSVIRGNSVPVVDLSSLLDQASGEQASGERHFGRFVLLEVNGRAVALAVDAVRGLSSLDFATIGALPRLLGKAGSAAVESLSLLDSELLLVLEAGRLLPDESVLHARAEPA
jgi:purine-binding chemotaxis protein CheW